MNICIAIEKYGSIKDKEQADCGWGDTLEDEIATQSSILAWKIPWTKELGGLESKRLQRIGHN